MSKPQPIIRWRCTPIIFALFLSACDPAGLYGDGARRSLTESDYDRAAAVLDYNLYSRLLNAYVTPHWSEDGSSFWYARELKNGKEYRVVELSTGENKAAFDHQRLATALKAIVDGEGVSPEILAVVSMEDETARFQLRGGVTVNCDIARYECEIQSGDARPVYYSVAPDGKKAVLARDNNFWVRDLAAGDERPLTNDGAPFYAYGKTPDSAYGFMFRVRAGWNQPPNGVVWSPNSQIVSVARTDERNIETYPFVESVPLDGGHRPNVYEKRVRLPGDAPAPPEEHTVFDLRSGNSFTFSLDENWIFTQRNLAWSDDNNRNYAVVSSHNEAALIEINVDEATVRKVIHERSDTRMRLNEIIYDEPNVRVLQQSNEAVWFSHRDGWGHLYLYDLATGELKNQITSGSWLVKDILHIDENSRTIYFSAMGREAGRDPYYRHIYRASFDGDDIVLLTPENADHDPRRIAPGPIPSFFSPDGKVFIDTYSTVNTPPVSVLRSSADGKVIAVIEDSDASEIYDAGWTPPIRFNVKAADGETDIYGAVYLPPDYDETKKYPVLDAFYGGPQVFSAPHNFIQSVSSPNPVSRASLAQLGFIVVTIDARGTVGRSKEFNDAGFPAFADVQIEDHVVAIKQLASQYKGMDINRVGVYGHSFGGYTSARAILMRPDFYKVAASSAGSHNYQGMYANLDWFVGEPSYDGSPLRPEVSSIPDNYKLLDNATYAENLTGNLMLAYGDMDENAFPSVTIQLADALIKANKTFDLVYLPNRAHGFFRGDPYYTRRIWDYFVMHLADADPPQDYHLKGPGGR